MVANVEMIEDFPRWRDEKQSQKGSIPPDWTGPNEIRLDLSRLPQSKRKETPALKKRRLHKEIELEQQKNKRHKILAMEVRKKTTRLFSVELLKACDDSRAADRLAAEIEKKLFAEHRGVDTGYCRAASDLAFNLGRNQELAPKLLNKSISVVNLLKMTSTELAPSEMRQLRAKELRENMKACQATVAGSVPTTMFKCPDCGSNNCEYVPASAFADVRKGEVWGIESCEGVKSRVYCKLCSNVWTAEVL